MPENYIHPSWRTERHLACDKALYCVSVSLPARFDFIGGWTDTPPYFFTRPSAVLNSSLRLIFRANEKSAPRDAIRVEVEPSQVFRATYNGNELTDISKNIVLSTVLRFLKLAHPQISISIQNDIPKGSGLGGSSLLAAAILSAIRGAYEGPGAAASDLRAVVDDVLAIEQQMKSGGGWQDQIGGIFPGIKLTRTLPYEDYVYEIRYASASDELSKRSLIVDTKITRLASKILCSLRDKFVSGDKQTHATLRAIGDAAERGFELLEVGDIDMFARLMTKNWEDVVALESSVKVPIVDVIKDVVGKDLAGYKIGGAGGGGFVLLVANDAVAKERMAVKLESAIPHCEICDVQFGGEGKGIFSEGEEFRVPPHERV